MWIMWLVRQKLIIKKIAALKKKKKKNNNNSGRRVALTREVVAERSRKSLEGITSRLLKMNHEDP